MNMDYRRGKVEKTAPLDLITDHFPIKDAEALKRGLPNELRGLDVERTVTVPGQGVVFYGRHNIQIGQFKYISSTGKYEFKYNPAAKETIEVEDIKAARKEQRRKLKVQRRNKFIAISLASVIALTGIGIGINQLSNAGAESSTQVEQPTKRVNLQDMPDAVKIAWANYAMSEYQDMVSDSEIEARRYSSEDLYQHYFCPIFRCYYDYCEIESSPIEKELSQGYSERLHNEFDSNLESFEERLMILTYNERLLINNTPYAQARVLDETPNPDAIVYVPLSTLPEGTPYNANNLPEGTQLIDGQIYVPDKCLYETVTITK